MSTRTTQRIDLEALTAADDAKFWELAATYGYHRPAEIDPDQAWFWTRDWLTGEIEADLSSAEGRGRVHYSTEEFLAALDQAAADADARRRG